MQIILLEKVANLGQLGDVVNVKNGFARNFLIPQGLAVPLSSSNKRRIEVLRQRRAEREALEFNSMSELGKSLNKVTLTLLAKTGDDGKMFGSVTSGSIADALKTQLEVSLDKKKIHLEKAIHALGEYEVELRLHPEVKSSLKIIVKSANPLPEVPAEAKAEAPKTEKRGRRAEAAEAPAPAPEAKPAKAGKGSKAK